jgi:hypothetical protein
MANRPPEDDNDARTRWMVINATRLVGVVIVLAGILGLKGRIPLPAIACYAFIAFGLFDVFAVPLILARKWRTPD